MDDLISRAQAIEAVRELTKWYYETFHEKRPTADAVIDKLMTLPSAQSEPCEDAVSRQAVIDAARKVHDIFEGEYDTRTPYGVIFDVQCAVIELPSVQPKIIRCKDCKYADEDVVCQNDKGLAIQDDDDFCSYAERKIDD